MGFSVVILKLKLLKDERQSGAGDVSEDVQVLLRAASHRLYGSVLVRQSHKKIVRAKTKPCPEDAKKSDSDEFFSSHGFFFEDGPAPDFNISKSTITFRFASYDHGLSISINKLITISSRILLLSL